MKLHELYSKTCELLVKAEPLQHTSAPRIGLCLQKPQRHSKLAFCATRHLPDTCPTLKLLHSNLSLRA